MVKGEKYFLSSQLMQQGEEIFTCISHIYYLKCRGKGRFIWAKFFYRVTIFRENFKENMFDILM